MRELKQLVPRLQHERALLVEVETPASRSSYDPLQELANLVDTAGLVAVERSYQRRARIDPAYYVGKGKAAELRDVTGACDIDVIVFDNDLSPAQIRNLEKLTDTKVIDRSELILDIFASHARTKQAKLQVELAQLEYTYPRLTRMWAHLSRIQGVMGTGGGIATRGPGEQQLEVDRRLVRKRVVALRRDIKKIEARKVREVKGRQDFYTVSVVGYTNAGKSTLMNALTDAHVPVADKLFATLDTRTRAWSLDGRRAVLLSDTVGFIRNLPHHLITSFKATLEEARQADLLLHVVDISQEDVVGEVDAVLAVLRELGCDSKPTITVFNKADLLEDQTNFHILAPRFRDHIVCSALKGEGLDGLEKKVLEVLEGDMVEAVLSFPVAEGKLLHYFYDGGEVLANEVHEGRLYLQVRLKPGRLAKAQSMCAELQLDSTLPA